MDAAQLHQMASSVGAAETHSVFSIEINECKVSASCWRVQLEPLTAKAASDAHLVAF